jgi:hypothetical protein
MKEYFGFVAFLFPTLLVIGLATATVITEPSSEAASLQILPHAHYGVKSGA